MERWGAAVEVEWEWDAPQSTKAMVYGSSPPRYFLNCNANTHAHTHTRARTNAHTHTRARAHKRTQTHARTTDARRRTHLGVVGVVGVIGVRLFVCAAALRALLLHAWALNDRRLAHHNKHT